MADILQRLATGPHAIDFFRAIRELEASHPGRAALGRSARPAQDAVRLGQEASVEFAPAALAGWEPGSGTAEGGEAAGGGRPPRLLVRFFGLFGPDGPLPLHLTEYARDRLRNNRDASFARFADLFHHRMLSLLYRAWADVRPAVSVERPEFDRYPGHVGALAGLGTPALRDRDAMPDLLKLHFSGLLGNQTRHADGLSAILSAFFTVPVQVEQFVGGWLALPPADRTRLGGRPDTARLGGGALLGGRSWSRTHRFRLVFGPMDLVEYERLLPDGNSFAALVPIVRNYAGDSLGWSVVFVLERDQVPDTRLGRRGRLGWTTWLKPRRSERHATDLELDAGSGSAARRTRTTGGRPGGGQPADDGRAGTTPGTAARTAMAAIPSTTTTPAITRSEEPPA